MNHSVYLDSTIEDDERRELLYEGQLFVYSPRPSTIAFADFARALVEEAFQPHDPEFAQFEMAVEDYVAILAELKPKFIHHPESKRFIREIFADFGCDAAETYFDVPRLRSSTSDGYLTSGIAYAFHPHRDTWYSAPANQINWWMPVFDLCADNGLAIHPRYFKTPLENSSSGYDYYEWNKKSRGEAAKHVKKDTREQPKAIGLVELDPQIRFVAARGSLTLFSAAHLHSSVPNTSGRTRFSIDFRVVNRSDVAARRGARNIDSECTGTNLRDYLCASDLARLPDEIISLYDGREPPQDAMLVFAPEGSGGGG